MKPSNEKTTLLLDRAAQGSASAVNELLAAHRPRLRTMIAARLDSRLAGRLDPSDVVQDVLAVAHHRLSSYLSERPISFHLWLRRLALDQMSELHRQHVLARKRSVTYETFPQLSDDSIAILADRLLNSSPSHSLMREELRDRVQTALNELPEHDRELLIMRYVEQLSLPEIAAALEISLPAAKSRHLRALKRIGQQLSDLGGER